MKNVEGPVASPHLATAVALCHLKVATEVLSNAKEMAVLNDDPPNCWLVPAAKQARKEIANALQCLLEGGL